jgi:hypothetical protein
MNSSESTGGADAASELMVFGALVAGYAQACVNLNIVAGQRAMGLVSQLDVNAWYPLSRWRELESVVVGSYKNAGPIMVKVGIEMMTGWYHYGPGRALIRRGVDFLTFQTGSNGFTSVVRGPQAQVGAFELVSCDPGAGRAVIRSTTPFNRKMECGVLVGGLLAPGDIDYVDVTNDGDPDLLRVEFH